MTTRGAQQPDTRRSNGDSGRRPRIAAVVGAARREIEALTGRPVESVSAVRRSDDGWVVSLEVVELERIPASTSVLGTYEAVVDGDGSLVEYERTRRYYRNRADEEDG